MKSCKIIKKFLRFQKFTLAEARRIVKKMTKDELLELWCEYSPFLYYNSKDNGKKLLGLYVVYSVGNELKRRYPYNSQIQLWNLNSPLNLFDILKDEP